MSTIYCFQIDPKTLEIEQHESQVEYADSDDTMMFSDEPCYEIARYNEDGFNGIYAESLVSMDQARRLVMYKCNEMWQDFQRAFCILFDQELKGVAEQPR